MVFKQKAFKTALLMKAGKKRKKGKKGKQHTMCNQKLFNVLKRYRNASTRKILGAEIASIIFTRSISVAFTDQ